MEAQYLTNENGENVGVYMGLRQYEATREAQRELDRVRREIEENQRTIALIEGILVEVIETARRQGQEGYEDFLEFSEGQMHTEHEPEKAERLKDVLENVEARLALEADLEQEQDFVPWSEAKRRIAAERAAPHQ